MDACSSIDSVMIYRTEISVIVDKHHYLEFNVDLVFAAYVPVNVAPCALT